MALKGLGGYQLACDAHNRRAIARLRRNKRRPAKPLAVMLPSCAVDLLTTADRAAFLDPTNAIVVLSAESAARLPALPREPLSPGAETLGVFRATTPLHACLLETVGRPLVVTSGNLASEPLAYEEDSAARELGPLVDLLVHHDRRIVRPIDDSVVRVIAGRPVTLRAARGIAPLSLDRFPSTVVEREERPVVLAVGGHQKAAVALCNGPQRILGPHIGDLDSPATRERYETQIAELLALYRAEPEAIVCDLHPDYFTTRWAEQQSLDRGVPLIRVQHHHAHVVAGMLENGWLDREVLGVAFDGTGYGTDGTIWGGEFLRVREADFQRVAFLRPFILSGGEMAVRQPWRTAASLLSQAFAGDAPLDLLREHAAPTHVAAAVELARKRLGPSCSSMGRLFDGVAALVLGVGEARFEGELAMRFEAVCEQACEQDCEPDGGDAYAFPIDDTQAVLQLDWRPLIRQVVADCLGGANRAAVARKFHLALATAVDEVSARFRELPVILGGGCFQNRRLTEQIADRLHARKVAVGLPGKIPPNDGGLAAGQLLLGLARLTHGDPSPLHDLEVGECA